MREIAFPDCAHASLVARGLRSQPTPEHTTSLDGCRGAQFGSLARVSFVNQTEWREVYEVVKNMECLAGNDIYCDSFWVGERCNMQLPRMQNTTASQHQAVLRELVLYNPEKGNNNWGSLSKPKEQHEIATQVGPIHVGQALNCW